MYLFLWNVLKTNKKKNKTPFIKSRTPLPKNWIIPCSLQASSVSFAVLCRDIEFLGVQLQTSRNYFQVPLPPICRSLQKITAKNRTTVVQPLFQQNITNFRPPHPHPGLHKSGLQHFSNAMKNPAFVLQFVFFPPFFFFKWMNLNKNSPKNSDRNIKCPSVSARACHPSCCTLVSSDERQPPNM